tara:strand:- start:128 stop:340 length:213 start_codon:yes stop_codon:yes gene_type:complete
MKNLEELWGRIGSVTKDEVVTAVLKDEISLYESRIQPSETGYLYDSIAQLKRRIEEIEKVRFGQMMADVA